MGHQGCDVYRRQTRNTILNVEVRALRIVDSTSSRWVWARRAMPLQIRVSEVVGAWPCRAPNPTEFDTDLIYAVPS